MSFYTNFTAKIEHSIASMSYGHQCLFLLLTCDKMLPNYVSFSAETNWGNPQVFKDAMSTLEHTALGKAFAESELKVLSKSIEENIPDLEAFETGSFAFDSSIVFNEAILFLINQDPENLVNAIQGALDTVDMFVQMKDNLDPNDKAFEAKIQDSLYLKREVNRQQLMIDHLSRIQKITKEAIEALQQINERHGAITDLNLLV